MVDEDLFQVRSWPLTVLRLLTLGIVSVLVSSLRPLPSQYCRARSFGPFFLLVLLTAIYRLDPALPPPNVVVYHYYGLTRCLVALYLVF